jgi:hypothetical protein
MPLLIELSPLRRHCASADIIIFVFHAAIFASADYFIDDYAAIISPPLLIYAISIFADIIFHCRGIFILFISSLFIDIAIRYADIAMIFSMPRLSDDCPPPELIYATPLLAAFRHDALILRLITAPYFHFATLLICHASTIRRRLPPSHSPIGRRQLRPGQLTPAATMVSDATRH